MPYYKIHTDQVFSKTNGISNYVAHSAALGIVF